MRPAPVIVTVVLAASLGHAGPGEKDGSRSLPRTNQLYSDEALQQ